MTAPPPEVAATPATPASSVPRRHVPAALRPVLGLLGCVVLAVAVAVAAPDPSEQLRRRWSDAGPGAWAVTPDRSARVTSVAVVGTVDPGYGDVLASRQALVVAQVDVAVRHRVAQLNHVYLRTADDKEYAPRSELSSAGLAQTQPGFTRHATLVFEVPSDRLPRAELVVDADAASVDGYTDAIRLDLGLGRTVRVSPETVTPAPASVTTT
ncbi:hypothetical protein [Microlunatus flavus]|uniref:Uncharacterized protein n=1 Tax=Microlunatus flavus TaxID=1036181 RepID=A0A1H9FNP2_9ACTN|nr:hypothetical protein [Microlunatus flavus]SEQ39600.1 hypothetical protein SAMN05421756_103333 [Microlunatus flavus]